MIEKCLAFAKTLTIIIASTAHVQKITWTSAIANRSRVRRCSRQVCSRTLFCKTSRYTRPGGRYDMRTSRIITDYRLSQKRNIFVGVMYSTIRLIYLVFVCRKSIHFWRRCARKTLLDCRFHWPWPLTFRTQLCSPSYYCPALCLH